MMSALIIFISTKKNASIAKIHINAILIITLHKIFVCYDDIFEILNNLIFSFFEKTINDVFSEDNLYFF